MLIQTGNYLNLIETENGNLKLELNSDGKAELLSRTISHCENASVYSSVITGYGSEKGFRCENCHQWLELGWKESHAEILADLFDDIRCNSSHEIIAPEEIGALTSAPIIALDVVRDEDGEFVKAEKIFWFEQYAVESELENLLRDGFVIFQNAEVW